MSHRRLAAVAVLGLLLAACGSTGPTSTTTTTPAAPATTAAPQALPQPVAIVPATTTDATAAIQAAINTAGIEHGSVLIAAGHFTVNGKLTVHQPVVISGAGSQLTTLVEQADTTIIEVGAPGVTVENLDLDNSANATSPVPKAPDPGTLFSNQSNTTVRDVTAQAGSGYGMRFVGPQPCATDLNGGQIISGVDVTTTGTGGFAALDISCQHQATISAVTVHGGTVALYRDQGVTVNGETYFKSPAGITCQPAWELSEPATDISINGVITHAGRGRILTGPDGLLVNPANLASQRIVIGAQIVIGNCP